MKSTRRSHGAAYEAQIALATVKGDKTLAELAEQFRVHPTPITEWKQHLLARAANVFGGTNPTLDAPDLRASREDWGTALGMIVEKGRSPRRDC